MKATLILAAIAQVASAHYFFDTNIINGVVQPSGKYVRSSTRPIKYNPIKYSDNPAVDIRDNSYIDKGDDARCNQGASLTGGKVEVLTVNAGDEVRVRLAVGATMQHPGPMLAYMSKAPDSGVKGYDGSGGWFKIYQQGVKTPGVGDFTTNAWASWDLNWIAATIPKATPNGEYLVRFEHIGIHKSHVHQPEHFVSCVQVKVQNGGTGTPGPLVQFPGAYKYTDPYVSFSIYGGHKTFPFPGPAVWDGSSSSSGSQSSAAASSTLATSTKASVPTSTKAAVPTTTKAAVPTTTKASVPTTTRAVVVPTTTKSVAAAPSATVPSTCGGQ